MILILLLSLSFASCCLGQDFNYFPIVSTSRGKYMGSVIKTRLGKPIYQFRGIRYAKAPIGALRFQPPVMVDEHEEIYNATNEGPYCPQHMNFLQSEDCLMLNVFTTELPSSKEVKRPVIVFIYSGGFYNYGAPYFGPKYLLDQDIVLVTFNYRLGVLGFLATGTKESPGNNALKDQVMALKWVQLNIASFGGDPNSVTLLGCGAGARSVTLHMVSPMTKGLFHKAIALSGSAVSPNPIGTDQLDLAKKQATIVGCNSETSEHIFKCLKTVSAEKLGFTTPLFAEWLNYPVLRWKYVIEPDFGQERFLTDHPMNLMENGQFHNIPFMAGITRDEFSFKAIELAQNPALLKTFDKNWDYLAPMIFHLDRNASSDLTSNLRELYFGNSSIDQSQVQNLGKAFAEIITEIGINRAIRLISNRNNQSCYYSQFSYKGQYSNYLDAQTKKPVGVFHHDDLIYLFNTVNFPEFNSTESKDTAMIEKLTKLYYNFAKYGNPTPDLESSEQWQPYNETSKYYMNIDSVLELKENLNGKRYQELEKIF